MSRAPTDRVVLAEGTAEAAIATSAGERFPFTMTGAARLAASVQRVNRGEAARLHVPRELGLDAARNDVPRRNPALGPSGAAQRADPKRADITVASPSTAKSWRNWSCGAARR
jgi:hypothetical protein